MSPIAMSFVAFVCIFGGTFLGIFLRNRLPDHHLSGDTKDVDGAPLDKPYSWKFSTIAPQILNITPNGQSGPVGLNQLINIQFNQPMDPATTKAAFSLRNSSGSASSSSTRYDVSSGIPIG